MMQYLKKTPYYNNLYDLLTIRECLQARELFRKDFKKLKSDKSLPVNDKHMATEIALEIFLYSIRGERYRHKQSRIEEWMASDRVRQDKYDDSLAPEGINCPDCDSIMHSATKTLTENADKLQVLFFFRCPSCGKNRGIYDNGDEHIAKPPKCPRCSSRVSLYATENCDVITWTTSCPACGLTDTEVDDFGKKRQEREIETQRDNELLKLYRDKFCLSEMDGTEYIRQTNQMKLLMEMTQKDKEKKSNPAYKKISKLKKLTVYQVQELLKKKLSRLQYQNFQFEKPEMGRHVVVSFSTHDTDSSRSEYDSKNQLQKLINKSLKNTVWRLMTDGVAYRMGFLTGRLKGYEQEEDLFNLAK